MSDVLLVYEFSLIPFFEENEIREIERGRRHSSGTVPIEQVGYSRFLDEKDDLCLSIKPTARRIALFQNNGLKELPRCN